MSWIDFVVAVAIVGGTIVAAAAWPRRAAVPPISRRAMQHLLERDGTSDPDGTG